MIRLELAVSPNLSYTPHLRLEMKTIAFAILIAVWCTISSAQEARQLSISKVMCCIHRGIM